MEGKKSSDGRKSPLSSFEMQDEVVGRKSSDAMSAGESLVSRVVVLETLVSDAVKVGCI